MTRSNRSQTRSKSILLGLQRLQSYQQQWWRGDVLAGLTVAAYAIPQCMAYGELAGVDPVAGLWTIVPAMAIYSLVGSSPQLSVGPESTTAVMTVAAIAPIAAADGSDYAALSACLALLVGGICLAGYIAKLGFLADLLSKPILVGYMAGVACIMIASQLGKIGGLSIDANSFIGEIAGFITHLSQIHGPTLGLAAAVLGFLWLLRWRVPTAPGPLIAVLLAGVTVAGLGLESRGVEVVGSIPAGLPQPTLPTIPPSDLVPLIASAIGIALVGYSDNVLTARAFANRNRYTIDANQELLALGIANVGAGLAQGFPLSSSGSRTVIGDSLGSKSQVFSLVAGAVIVAVLLFLRPLLAVFPTAALGALVIFAACKLIDIPEFIRLYRFRRTELALALATTIGVLATDILVGVAVAVGLSVIDVFARIARPHDAVQGTVPGLDGLHDIDDWDNATTLPGLVLYRYDAPLCFANAENFKRRALEALAAEQHPVDWFVLNTEAIAEIDITAADMLAELHRELQERGIVFGLARVKQDLATQLKQSGLQDLIGTQYLFSTLNTAIDQFQTRQSLPPTASQFTTSTHPEI